MLKTIHELDDYSRHWLDKGLTWASSNWDEEKSLIRMPLDRKYQGTREERCGVRDSVWYATGLLMRQRKGDVERACRIIETIMTYQFDDPSTVYHGTFRRYPEEPDPPTNPTEWRDYDPNWREFICTVFIILMTEFSDLLPESLQDKMRQSILLATEGAFERKVRAEYTNISLMSAFLLDYSGDIFDKPVWREYALEQAHKIYALFNRNITFDEYNSPTYYGVDFFALALWREYGSTEEYRHMGSVMEAELWRDLAQFYHADMRNICGPYDRSYGMDMTEYVAVVGLWIAMALPGKFAPLPDIDQPFDHAGDFYFVPLVALVGTKPPADVLPHLTQFQGERFLERTIEPERNATAWLSDTLMIGAESDHLNSWRSNQFHPATIHWIAPDGSIGWIRTRCEALIQASAKPAALTLSSNQGEVEYIFEVYSPEIKPEMIQSIQWKLPGLTVELDREETPFNVEHNDDVLTVKFSSDQPVNLSFTVNPVA